MCQSFSSCICVIVLYATCLFYIKACVLCNKDNLKPADLTCEFIVFSEFCLRNLHIKMTFSFTSLLLVLSVVGLSSLSLQSVSSPPLTADQFVCHTEAIADIVILVDGSWSIGRLNFRLVRMFLENLVNAFDVGIDKTRIGGSPLLPFLNRWAHHGTNMVF